MRWIKNQFIRFKKWILTFLGIGVIVISLGVINAPIPDKELLKTDKANIISSRVYDGDKVQYAFKNGVVPLKNGEIRNPHGSSFLVSSRKATKAEAS